LTPFRLKLVPLPCVEESVIRRNLAHAKSLPRAVAGEHKHPVAICGGGPSLSAHLDELRAWPGDIWAINHTANYLLSNGIDCTLFTIDPNTFKSRAVKRLVATCCDPVVLEGAQCFALAEHEEGGVTGGTTSAGRAPLVALRLGYPGAVFFGCEGSFEDRDHVDRHVDVQQEAMVVHANGCDFNTYIEYCDQSAGLAELLCEFPGYFVEKSGGLLAAMTRDPMWSVVAVSSLLRASLIEANGDTGLYDEPYKGRKDDPLHSS
jgi:hypothetical protein